MSRRKYIHVSAEAIAEVLKRHAGLQFQREGIPDGMKVIACMWDSESEGVIITVEGPQFMALCEHVTLRAA